MVGASSQGSSTVSGVVLDPDGPVAGARVRVRATEILTYTQSNGFFILNGLDDGEEIEVAAWADGYYIASTFVTPTISGITLTLRPYHTTDHPDYEWVSPISGTSETACGNCHPMILPQWENNAHGGAISNNRFFSLYNGTNISGTVSIGPGYLNDFPGTAGVCANCHAAGAGVDGYLTTNMNTVRDELTSGIHCDFCHKVGGAYLNLATGSVYPNAPGVTSLRVLRPPAGDQIFFGPYDDIHDPDTYLPTISESQFCAACHQFSFWGTPIYESYEEWLASDYAESGVTCQKCHMPPNGDTHFALPEVGGLEHPPEIIPSHLQIGATDIDLLQNTMSMDVTAQQFLGQLTVTVVITNTGAGHHVPTDFPGRQMILLVTVEDQGGLPLIQSDGAKIPSWGGEFAGSPGIAYAKILRDVGTGESPVVSYWKQTLIDSDNRIPALGTDISHYIFDIPNEGRDLNLTAKLIFRRTFQSLADQKGWDIPDILMEEKSLTFSPIIYSNIYLPLVIFDITP
jgi:hypothetical protein